MTKVSESTRRLTTMAMLTAISIVLVSLIHFPIFPAAPWMEYDPADIPIFVGTFLYGPWAGLGLTLIVSVIQGTTVSAGAGIIGIIMHFCATGAFSLVAGGIYKRKHTHTGAAIGLICGALTMTVVMVLWNLILTPIFMGAPREAVLELMLPVILPFNLLKAGVNGLATYIVYKPIGRLLRLEVNTAEPAFCTDNVDC